MAQALCLKCGGIKHDPFCRCFHCGGRADPDRTLAEALSERHLSRELLVRLGELVRDIAAVSPDGDVRHGALLLFFNDAMPTRFHRVVDRAVEPRARDALAKVSVPAIRIVSAAGPPHIGAPPPVGAPPRARVRVRSGHSQAYDVAP